MKDGKPFHSVNRHLHEFNRFNTILFNPTTNPYNHYVMALDKTDKSMIKFFRPWNGGQGYSRDGCPEKHLCTVPKFIEQMDKKFLERIDYIIYYESNDVFTDI